MTDQQLEITEQSIRNELIYFKDKPYDALFEYIWNAFDAGAKEVKINYLIPKENIGYIDKLEISDNGSGWDFQRDDTTTFLASKKAEQSTKNKSLPKGRLGRGRYVFIWFCEAFEALSNNKYLLLKKDTKVTPTDSTNAPTKGTKIILNSLNDVLSNALKNENILYSNIILEFCWFLKENPSFRIELNGREIDLSENINKEVSLRKVDFIEDLHKYLDDDFVVDIVLWKKKPQEWAKFYFIDSKSKQELFTQTTNLNKKSDDYWHSVYIRSNLFLENDDSLEQDVDQQELVLEDKEIKKIKKKIIIELKKKLIELRKPLLIERSEEVITYLKKNEILPKLDDYGIYDTKSYDDLLKIVYVIAPSLLSNKNDKEIAFNCAVFAGLLSSQDVNLIKIVLEQLQELTEEEKQDLEDILKRTSLSNIVITIKEIDYRLQVLNDLEKLLFEYRKSTLEVKHLQKVLNANPWLFGEQFRLFRNTEGALHKTLFDYAKSILNIDNPEIITDSRKEVDLFLVKTNEENEYTKRNIIVEIKRPSVILGQKEYGQIKDYALTVRKEPSCNGNNIYWEYYLIGDSYDDVVDGEIKSASVHGEHSRGLTYNPDGGRLKIYVRKWSDILQTEWGYKMKYLKEKLMIKAKKFNLSNSPSIAKRYSDK